MRPYKGLNSQHIHIFRILFGAGILALPWMAHAQTPPIIETQDDIQRRQREQLERAQQAVTPPVDVLQGTTPVQAGELQIPKETPCFEIKTIEWQDVSEFTWLKRAAQPVIGQCLGAKGVKALQEHLTARLIKRGYITSRVLIPDQNLASNTLIIQVIPGRIGKVTHEGKPIGWVRTIMPTGEGGLLNQRDLDQALENIRRLPGQANVEFEIKPGQTVGESDVLFKHKSGNRISGIISIDDSGTKSTGQYPLTTSVSIDSPFYLYDSLTYTHGRNSNWGVDRYGNKSNSLRWNMPIGYWSVNLGAEESEYHQTIKGYSSDFVYSGKSRTLSTGLSRIVYRSTNNKGQFTAKIFRTTSHSFVDDTEIEVQMRDYLGYELGFSHRQYWGNIIIDAGIGMRASLPSRSKSVGYILDLDNWDGHWRTYSANLQLAVPFKLLEQQFTYQTSWKWQTTNTPLPSSEYFSVGGRSSVRGFDYALSAEKGWYWRNDLSMKLGNSGQEIGVGVDVGRVSGPNTQWLAGQTVASASFTYRGQLFKHINYDLTASYPIHQPEGYQKRRFNVFGSVLVQF